ncbi:hypothetical protein pb186bvf_003440 [Paramecium bursaria]
MRVSQILFEIQILSCFKKKTIIYSPVCKEVNKYLLSRSKYMQINKQQHVVLFNKFNLGGLVSLIEHQLQFYYFIQKSQNYHIICKHIKKY